MEIMDSIDEFQIAAFFISFTAAFVLIINVIIFFILKLKLKKTNELEKKLLNEEIKKVSFICIAILLILGIIYLLVSEYISKLVFGISISLFAVAFIIRLFKNKKVLSILWKMIAILSCAIVLENIVSNKTIDNYNDKFFQYEKIYTFESLDYIVDDIDGLINTTIDNNKNGKKVTIIYQNENYTTEDELKQLLSKLETNEKYSILQENNCAVTNTYYIETKKDKYGYIESIILSKYIKPGFKSNLDLDGKSYEGNSMKTLCSKLISLVSSQYYETINVIYISETNQITIMNLKDDLAEFVEFKNGISEDKMYNVEVYSDLDVCNIIIENDN